jgi:gamma-butyrobetaine dioxygenase
MNGVRMTSLPASVGPAGPEAPDGGLVAGLPAIWLRCTCPCALCRDPASGQRLLRPEEAVLREGLLLLSQVPADPGTVLEVAASLGYVRETNYGRLFDVRVETSPANLAFTSLPILPHTDNPYRDPVPTVQLLHGLHNAAGGGDSGFVDGFHAAAALRALNPAAFATLAVTPVTFRYRDAVTELSATRPLISLDTRGRLREIRVNSAASSRSGCLPRRRQPATPRTRPSRSCSPARPRRGPCACAGICRAATRISTASSQPWRWENARRRGHPRKGSDMTAADPVRVIADLFAAEGASEYLGEPVTQAQHMLQAAALAEAAGAAPELVAAALLHDVGHFTGTVSGHQLMTGTGSRHGDQGAEWLACWFGPGLTEPVRLHVAAKRYLCAVEPGYFGGLSAASVHTLRVQGGPMTPAESAEFEASPWCQAALRLRRWDDAAKDPGAVVPAFGYYQRLLRQLVRQNEAGATR